MALASLALRLSLLAALRTPVNGHYPTLAAAQFHDSRMAEIAPDEAGPIPAVVMSIESRSGSSLSAQNGRGPYQPTVDIIFGLHVFVRATWRDDSGEEITGMVAASTDHEAEDLLDTLESQILYALEASPLVRRIAPRWMTGFAVEPYRDDTTGERFSVRSLKITAEIVDDGLPALQALSDDPDVPVDLRGRAETAISRITEARAVVDGETEPFEQSDDQLVQGGAPADVPDAQKIPFTGFQQET